MLARRWRQLALALCAAWCAAGHSPALAAESAAVRLPGHVLQALALPTITQSTRDADWQKWMQDAEAANGAPLVLTFVLKHDDEDGFQQYLRDVYDANSPRYRKFLTPAQVAERFGPSQQSYDDTAAWLKAKHFEIVENSANRMTLLAKASRGDVELAFDIGVRDYVVGERSFYANDSDPALPPGIARHVQSISGLSNLATPAPDVKTTMTVCGLLINKPVSSGSLIAALYSVFAKYVVALYALKGSLTFVCGGMMVAVGASGFTCMTMGMLNPAIWTTNPQCAEFASLGGGSQSQKKPAAGGVAAQASVVKQASPPNTQKIGLLEFDTFHRSDVEDWLTAMGGTAYLDHLTQVHVNGGVASPGAGESEVLLDIDLVMMLGGLPDVYYTVYDGLSQTGFATMFNAMINDGVTVISNSWSQCEDQTSLAEAQGIDAVLQQAAASGISVFNASGDSGSTCLDGSANTVGVPADSPNATAVGGSTPTPGEGVTYGTETWWDGSADTPQTGQGGYGVSALFPRPSYQDAFTAASGRSVPDVVADADPAQGIMICQASAGGCPGGRLFGGTSAAAPQWAAYAADLNVMTGVNMGSANVALYPLANTTGFHSAASMGSDFEHVGLGSPDVPQLALALAGLTPGAVSPEQSVIVAAGTNADQSVPADGTTAGIVQIMLRDADGRPVAGKTVSLSASGNAVLSQSSSVADTDGNAVFQVTDLTAEAVTFTAVDTSDGTPLTATATLTFGVPPAASGSIQVIGDTTVAADGLSTTTILVTLQDALARPTPGKQVVLLQGGGSVIAGPDPGVTDASGQIQFKVSDTVQEFVDYFAVDTADGNLQLPGYAYVTFSAGGSDGCGSSNYGVEGANITAGPGYAITPYATGFLPKRVSGNGIISQCRGAYGLAFDADGNLFVSSAADGNIYRFPPGGGAVGASTLLTPSPLGPFLAGLTFDKNGHLYAAQLATGYIDGGTPGNVFTGAVLEVDPSTGALLRTVASAITCASFLTTDPASGDLFVDDSCGGGGSENASLWRIADPGSATPTTSVYAKTIGNSTNGGLSFAPGGTLYAIDYFGTGVSKVTGTATTPTVVTSVHGIAGPALDILALGDAGNGDAQTLIVSTGAQTGGLPAGMKIFDARSDPAVPVAMVMNNAYATVNLLGPDGCLYASTYTAVYRITNADGSCPLQVDQPALTLTPYTTLLTTLDGFSPGAALGEALSLTATFHFATVPEGTPVWFEVTGANPTLAMVRTDASGAATFTYSAARGGQDLVVASATLDDKTLVSNQSSIIWGGGRNLTVINLNLAPGTASLGQATTVQATLLDATLDPLAPVAGASILFTAGDATCSGVTDEQGTASCVLTPVDEGLLSLTARFAGDDDLQPASATASLLVVAPATVPKANVNAVPTSLAFGDQAVVTPSATLATTLTNTGGAAFTLGTVSLAGANAGDFATTSGTQACTNGAVLAAGGGSCTVYVVFTPSALGPRAANVVVTDAGGGADITVPLTGTGVAPAAACYTGTLAAGGTATACVAGSQPACQFTDAAFVPASSISTPPPTDVTLPYGLFRFTATGCGSALTLTVQYPSSLPAGTRYEKFGGTSAQPADHWYSLPASVSGNTLRVTIADGGDGDSDLAVNGSISDPGGPAVTASVPVVAIQPIDTLDRRALTILAAILAALAMAGTASRRRGG